MQLNRNKLRKGNPKKAWVQFGITVFVLVFAFMIYATYVYLCYVEENGLPQEEFGYETIVGVAGALPSPTFSIPITPGLLGTLCYYQVINLWFVYAGVALLVFLAATGKAPNDYRGIEKGSAEWEDKYALKDFADNTGIPMANDFYATVENPKDNYYSSHNLNEIVIGGSGAGKSFRKIKPDIINMFGSYVVTDPKGELYRDTAKLLKASGYTIKVLNMINIKHTNTYNPFVYMKEEQDVISVADLFMKNTAGEGDKEDFWSGSAKDLLIAVMVYLFNTEWEMKCFGRVVRLVNSISYEDGKIDPHCELSKLMLQYEKDHEGLNDVVIVNWSSVKGTPEQTMGGIAKSLSTRLGLFAVSDVDDLTAVDEMDFDSIGEKLTAVFLIIPPARNPYKAIVNIFYSQLFERLMYCANFKHSGRLPKLVSCELDEFANIGTIPNFNETLAVVRSHNIRICIVLQGLSQLKALYEKTYDGIIGNCSLFTYLGTNDMDTKKYVVERLGKTTVRTDTRSYNKGQQGGGSSENESYDSRDLATVDELPIIMKAKGKSKKYGGYCILFIDEYRPFFVLKYNTLKHPKIGEVGSSYPKDRHNNTDIEREYGGLGEARAEKRKSKLDELNDNVTKSTQAVTQEQAKEEEIKKAAEESEQERLSEIWSEAAEAQMSEDEFDEDGKYFDEDIFELIDSTSESNEDKLEAQIYSEMF